VMLHEDIWIQFCQRDFGTKARFDPRLKQTRNRDESVRRAESHNGYGQAAPHQAASPSSDDSVHWYFVAKSVA
jgi:hypothetical protein